MNYSLIRIDGKSGEDMRLFNKRTVWFYSKGDLSSDGLN